MRGLSILLLLFFLVTTVHGSTYVVPEEVPVNGSVYVIYQRESPVNIHNFSLNIYSNGVQFGNNSVNVSHIDEGQKILWVFEGKVTELGNQSIMVSTSYTIINSSINSVELFQIEAISKRAETTENVVKNNTIILNNSEIQNTYEEINETNATMSYGKSESFSRNYSKTKNETKPFNTCGSGGNSTDVVLSKTNVKEDKGEIITLNDIYYIISGLIAGILLGLIIMYVYES